MITDNRPHTADTTTCYCFVICLSIIQMFKHDVYGRWGDEEIQDEHSMLVSSNIKQLNAELEGTTRAPPSLSQVGAEKREIIGQMKYKYSNRL